MSMIQKKRSTAKTKTKEERLPTQKQTSGDTGNGDGKDVSEMDILEPVILNQYTISSGAEEFVMPSEQDMTVAELRMLIQMNRPGGMSIDKEMPCFVNGEITESDQFKLRGNLRIEFTKKAGVKG